VPIFSYGVRIPFGRGVGVGMSSCDVLFDTIVGFKYSAKSGSMFNLNESKSQNKISQEVNPILLPSPPLSL
jgi:hypothetical protein